MITFAYVLLGIAILPYIAVPILIWSTQRFNPSVAFRLIQETFLPREVFKEFRSFSEPLIARNFEFCFDAFTHDEFLGLRFYHRILLGPIQKTWAICTAICDEQGILQRKYVEFKTQYLSKTSLSTHNSDLMSTPINSPKRKSIALPVETQIEILLTVHILNMKKSKFEEPVLVPQSQTALESFKEFLNQDHEDQLELGAIYFDAKQKIYRPTWAGAVLIGWYSMWPLTLIRRLYSTLKIRSLMKEIASANT